MACHSKSILQDDMTCCYECGRYGTEVHHVFFGTANRRLSDKYGLVVGLCYNHHRGNQGVHNGNRELDLKLKRYAQSRFIEAYPNEDFISVFGKSYFL